MAVTTAHAATDSAIGYFHQGLYALVVLLDAGDGASVSVETADDVVLDDSVLSLHQLKHSLTSVSAFTIKNDGLWKTVKVWCDGKPFRDEHLVLATCEPLQAGSELTELTIRGVARTQSLLEAFDAEASRVRADRARADSVGEERPFAKRAPGCEAWLGLSASDKQSLLERILLVPSSFRATDVPTEVDKRLRACVLPEVRNRIVERLIEWWDRQVVLSLLGKRQRWITKFEQQVHLNQLIIDHSARGLPNDLAEELPPDLSAEMTGVMARQIDLVSGGSPRIKRAAIARWRSRTQRERWLLDDFSIASELDKYDDRLIERWSDRYEPMQHDCATANGTEDVRCGLAILDWTHLSAHTEIPPIRPLFTAEYLVQETYQQLSDQQRVGWHPKYKELLSTPNAGGT